MSVVSVDESDYGYTSAIEDHEGVALAPPSPTTAPTSSARSPNVISIAHQAAFVSHHLEVPRYHDLNVRSEHPVQSISDNDEHKKAKTLDSVPISQNNSKPDLRTMIQGMRAYISRDPSRVSASAVANTTLGVIESHKTAPIFTSAIGRYLEAIALQTPGQLSPFTQYGLVGSHNVVSPAAASAVTDFIDHDDNLMIANMDVPWSAFICGSQGAGKSHTLSCLLENALVGDSEIGRLPNPLAGLVFHYDNYTNATCSQVCEAAYLCSSGIQVTVLVSPSNIWAMTHLYANLPGLPSGCPRPKVLPLYLSENLLDISTMLKLMAVDPNADDIPLYMETVMIILREMAMEGKGAGAFSYTEFRRRVEAVDWVRGQTGPLNVRLQLLDSFLQPTQFTKTSRPAPAIENIWAFEPGTLTIADLSDPFVNGNDACTLFSICLSLFLEGRGKCGRVVAMDEAHKFLLQSGAARTLTADLTSVIRQQRHTGTRVLIATQEPTLSPEIIDLANVTFVHRFTSPAWYDVLKKHLAGADRYDSADSRATLIEQIVNLQTGEALMFCPTALMSVDSESRVKPLGNCYSRVNIRKRLTADGGRSILASETVPAPLSASQPEIPMHVVVNPPKTTSNMTSGRQNTGNRQPPESHIPITPKAMLPQQAPQPSSSPTQPGIDIQPANSDRDSFPPSKLIEQEGRIHMRRYYENMGWHGKKDLRWPMIWRDVENALKLKSRTFALRSDLHVVLKKAVEAELAACRKGTK